MCHRKLRCNVVVTNKKAGGFFAKGMRWHSPFYYLVDKLNLLSYNMVYKVNQNENVSSEGGNSETGNSSNK